MGRVTDPSTFQGFFARGHEGLLRPEHRADFDETKHPRDKGRFASKPGEGKTEEAPRKWRTDLPDGIAQRPEAEYEKQYGKAKEGFSTYQTWMDHMTGNPETDKSAKATPERQGLHDEIMARALAAPPAREGEKRAIMTMGGPASGKSTILKGIDKTQFVAVDPDAIKEDLPEYKRAAGDRENTYRGAAAMAHEESSYLAKRIRDQAIENGQNLIVDGTGKNDKKFIELMDHLKAKGYKIHVAMPDLTPEEGMTRAHNRAERNGRAVPDDFIVDSYQNIPRNFERIAGHADSFALHDAHREGSPLVWAKDGRGTRVLDEKYVADFKARNGGGKK